MTAINIASKLGLFSERWSPKIVATFNGHDVMVVKLKGEFVGIRTPIPTTSSMS